MKQFLVYMTCTVQKQVLVECETKEEAEENPWDHAIDEMEISQDDWEVTDIKDAPQ